MNPAEYLRTPPEALMAKHAKTFSFAAAVLSSEQLREVARLYRLCRVIDDCADELPGEEGRRYLNLFLLGIAGKSSEFGDAFRELENLGVEKRHLSALIQGGLLDLNNQPILETQDVLHYCFLVAGVVGVMMCPLLGVRDPQALPYARDLGIAMQLTNICRDVKADAQINRVYLPDLGLSARELAGLSSTPKNVRASVKHWLSEADAFYESAYQGLAFLPLRARVCILIAGQVYRAIGQKVLRRDCDVLSGRVYLSKLEKTWVVFKSLPRLLRLNFWRRPKRRQELESDRFLRAVEDFYA